MAYISENKQSRHARIARQNPLIQKGGNLPPVSHQQFQESHSASPGINQQLPPHPLVPQLHPSAVLCYMLPQISSHDDMFSFSPSKTGYGGAAAAEGSRPCMVGCRPSVATGLQGRLRSALLWLAWYILWWGKGMKQPSHDHRLHLKLLIWDPAGAAASPSWAVPAVIVIVLFWVIQASWEAAATQGTFQRASVELQVLLDENNPGCQACSEGTRSKSCKLCSLSHPKPITTKGFW